MLANLAVQDEINEDGKLTIFFISNITIIVFFHNIDFYGNIHRNSRYKL